MTYRTRYWLHWPSFSLWRITEEVAPYVAGEYVVCPSTTVENLFGRSRWQRWLRKAG